MVTKVNFRREGVASRKQIKARKQAMVQKYENSVQFVYDEEEDLQEEEQERLDEEQQQRHRCDSPPGKLYRSACKAVNMYSSSICDNRSRARAISLTDEEWASLMEKMRTAAKKVQPQICERQRLMDRIKRAMEVAKEKETVMHFERLAIKSA